jgi:hypothetical protein
MNTTRLFASEIEAAVLARDFKRALVLAGRNEGPTLLLDWMANKRITKVEIAAVLPDIWSAAEWPSNSLAQKDWVWIFRLADYAKPTEPLQIYRGAPPRYARGMAWTTSLELARSFAQRWEMRDKPAFVYAVLAQPEAVLANIDSLVGGGGRNEHEIVVDPARLGPLTRLR